MRHGRRTAAAARSGWHSADPPVRAATAAAEGPGPAAARAAGRRVRRGRRRGRRCARCSSWWARPWSAAWRVRSSWSRPAAAVRGARLQVVGVLAEQVVEVRRGRSPGRAGRRCTAPWALTTSCNAAWQAWIVEVAPAGSLGSTSTPTAAHTVVAESSLAAAALPRRVDVLLAGEHGLLGGGDLVGADGRHDGERRVDDRRQQRDRPAICPAPPSAAATRRPRRRAPWRGSAAPGPEPPACRAVALATGSRRASPTPGRP